MRSRLRTLAMALALVGCRAPAEEGSVELDLTLPEAWSVDPEAASEEQGGPWWREFGDADLDALVAEALVNNRDLRASAARLEAAMADARAAGADRLPSLAAGLSGSRLRQNFVGLPIGGGGVLTSTTSQFGVSLDLSWELDLWGRIHAADQAAAWTAGAAEADWNAAALSITGQTAKAWFAASEARLQLELARKTAASFKESEDWVQRRFDRGLASAVDLRLARSNTADALAAVQDREIRARVAARQLERLAGRFPAARIEAPRVLPEPPGPIPAGLPSELLERRPDLVAARRRLLAADARSEEADAARLPRFALTASAGRTSNELDDLLDSDFDVWALAGNLTAPLFQGGRLAARSDAAAARVEEARAELGRLALIAFSEVEAALTSEAFLAARTAELGRATEEARAAEQLAMTRYRSGIDTLVVVLEAQRRAVQNEARWLEARRLRLDNRVDLVLALGGGYGSDAGRGTEGEELARADAAAEAGQP